MIATGFVHKVNGVASHCKCRETERTQTQIYINFLAMNPIKASILELNSSRYIILATPCHAAITMQYKLDELRYRVFNGCL